MKIEVFAEGSGASEKIAEFYDESVYAESVQGLEAWASANNWEFITETVIEEES